MSGLQDRVAAAPAGSVLLRHIAARAAQGAAGQSPVAEPPPPVPAARTPDRAVAGAVARAAERVHGLPLFFDKVTTGLAVVAELGDLFPDHALISVVEGPGDSLGAVAICPGLLTSLIEMQALGRISARPATPRRPTPTDGAICAEFLNACLAEIGADLAVHPGFEGLAGYRYASSLDNPRPLELMLEDVTYRLIGMSVRAGPAGQRDGRMVLLLPLAPARTAAPAIPAPGTAPEAAEADRGAGILADSVRHLPIELFGILCRRDITLGELQSLSPGDSISLPPGALMRATLETGTGQTLATGRLGELGGRHALRIAGTEAAGTAIVTGAGEAGAWDTPLDAGEPATFDRMPERQGDAPDAAEPPLGDLAGPDPFRGGFALGDLPSADDALHGGVSWDDEEPPALAPLAMQIG